MKLIRIPVVLPGLLLLIALPLHAAGVQPSRANTVQATTSVSVTIPLLTGFSLSGGSRQSSVAISLFRTSDVIVLRSTHDSLKQSPYTRVSLEGEGRDDGSAAVEMRSGGWSTINDEIPTALRRVSTSGESAGTAEVTYEIWAF